jgi:hypothetical protein
MQTCVEVTCPAKEVLRLFVCSPRHCHLLPGAWAEGGERRGPDLDNKAQDSDKGKQYLASVYQVQGQAAKT